MKTETNDAGATWIVAGLVTMAGALGMAITIFVLHTVREVPWWLVALLCVLVLFSVFCFGIAEELWNVEQARLEADAPEFGPARYHGPSPTYDGPERRRRERNPPRPTLRVVDVEGAQRRCGRPPSIDETV